MTSAAQPAGSPKNIVLFSGHMIDARDRSAAVPPGQGACGHRAIADTLSKIGVTRGDLAICGGRCGGDLLFAEACLAREMRVEIYIPFDEPTFLANSVDFAGADWHERYLAVETRRRCISCPTNWAHFGEGDNAYERNNQWMLDAADRFGGDRMAFICLWNGQGGDGPGGAQHLMEEARRKTARIYWLDTRKLWD